MVRYQIIILFKQLTIQDDAQKEVLASLNTVEGMQHIKILDWSC